MACLIHAGIGIAATNFAYKMFPTQGPPVCIMQPAVRFVSYAYTTKITQ